MLLSDLYNDTKKKLDNFNIESSEIDSKVIIKNVLGLEDKDLIVNTELYLSKIARDKLSKVIAERTLGKPISRIFGNKEFFSMNEKFQNPFAWRVEMMKLKQA